MVGVFLLGLGAGLLVAAVAGYYLLRRFLGGFRLNW